MTDITAGNTSTFTLAAGQELYVKTTGSAVIKYGRDIVYAPSVVSLSSSDGELRYGPHAVELEFYIQSVTGTVTYSNEASQVSLLPEDGSQLNATVNAIADALFIKSGGMTPADIGEQISYSSLPYGFLSEGAAIAIEGDSIMAIGAAGAQADWAVCAFSGGCGYRQQGFNVATGGETAEQMAAQVSTVLALSPELVYFGAGTNDIKNGRTADQIKSDISACVFGYLNGGVKYVYIFKVLKRVYGEYEFDSGQIEIMSAVNAHIDGLARSNNRIVCEGDVSWFASEHTNDGTHPNWFGAYERARRSESRLNSFWNRKNIVFAPYSSDNLVKSLGGNPEFSGTSGTSNATAGSIVGDIPDGWLVAQDAAVATTVTYERDFFGVGQHGVRLTCTGSSISTSNKLVKIRINPNPVINGVIGDAYEAWCKFHIDAGHYGLSSVQIDFATLGTVNDDSATAITGGGQMSGVMRSYTTAPLAANTTSAEYALKLTVRSPEAVPADSYCSVVFGVPYLRKIV